MKMDEILTLVFQGITAVATIILLLRTRKPKESAEEDDTE
jgi:hypothetical protein